MKDPRLNEMLDTLDSQVNAGIEKLVALLRIPSISTDPAHASDCVDAADWLVNELTELGFNTRRVDTEGHPMVVAHSRPGDARKLLFYGHYDVQPADPLELWDQPPFEPVIRDGAIHARGASDDKGQLMTFIEAFRAWKNVHGTLPSDLVLMFEGEEESGSPSLVPFLNEHADELRADMAMICDTARHSDGRPAITVMLRGLVGEEVVIDAANRDLHSGFYGGLAANPIQLLCNALGALKDADGRVTLPGFYDNIPEPDPETAADWKALGFEATEVLAPVGLSHPIGEADRTPIEMIWSRPTAEINGIAGGYAGAGFKTVLPAEARAKVSFRLVAGQDPIAIRDAFRAHVQTFVPDDCRVTFHPHGASAASKMDVSDPAFAAAKAALTQEWGREAAFVGAGGSIPIAGDFQELLGMDSMLIGFATADDRIHSPNEKYDLESFHKGARSWLRILAALRN